MHQFSSVMIQFSENKRNNKIWDSLNSRSFIFPSKNGYCRLGVNLVARDIESGHENSPDRTMTTRN